MDIVSICFVTRIDSDEASDGGGIDWLYADCRHCVAGGSGLGVCIEYGEVRGRRLLWGGFVGGGGALTPFERGSNIPLPPATYLLDTAERCGLFLWS